MKFHERGSKTYLIDFYNQMEIFERSSPTSIHGVYKIG
jgi:DNA phosphorothioation-dependent restriction protein DptG